MSHKYDTVVVNPGRGSAAGAQQVDELTAAYAALGKAFYQYRFEEPTPELLLYFDAITRLERKYQQQRPNSIPSSPYTGPNQTGSSSRGNGFQFRVQAGMPQNNFPAYDGNLEMTGLLSSENKGSTNKAVCPTCQVPVRPEQRFCTSCGRKLR